MKYTIHGVSFCVHFIIYHEWHMNLKWYLIIGNWIQPWVIQLLPGRHRWHRASSMWGTRKNCLAFSWWTSNSNFTMLCGTLKKRQEGSIKFGLFEPTFKSRPSPKTGAGIHQPVTWVTCDLAYLSWPSPGWRKVFWGWVEAIRPNNFGVLVWSDPVTLLSICITIDNIIWYASM